MDVYPVEEKPSSYCFKRKMYTVSKGPSKIVAKTRRGITQNLDRLDNLRDLRRNQSEDNGEIISLPKPVFQPLNGKKSHSFRVQQEAITPQHEEIIRFVHESWTSICKEGEEESSQSDQKNCQSSSKVVYYKCSEPNLDLKGINYFLNNVYLNITNQNGQQNFKPFDLESWWGKRLFNTITKSIP